MTRTIPEIRSRLYELAVEHGIPELAQLADETRRQYHGRRAPARARPVDIAIAARVQRFARLNPNMPQREIGRRFGIDGGRVSEILFGKRGGLGAVLSVQPQLVSTRTQLGQGRVALVRKGLPLSQGG